MTVEEPGINPIALIGATEIVNGVVYYMDKKHMYLKAPPIRYVALVELPASLLQLHAIMIRNSQWLKNYPLLL